MGKLSNYDFSPLIIKNLPESSSPSAYYEKDLRNRRNAELIKNFLPLRQPFRELFLFAVPCYSVLVWKLVLRFSLNRQLFNSLKIEINQTFLIPLSFGRSAFLCLTTNKSMIYYNLTGG